MENTRLTSIRKTDIETGIFKFMPGQIWLIPMSSMDNKAAEGTYEMTKTRPYLIMSVSNMSIEAAPLTSVNPKKNLFYLEIPRVMPDDHEVSYVVIPKTRVFDSGKLCEKYPTYKMSCHPKLFKRAVALLLAYRYCQYFDTDDMNEIVSDANEFYSNITDIEYYSSAYIRYNNTENDNIQEEDISSSCIDIDTFDPYTTDIVGCVLNENSDAKTNIADILDIINNILENPISEDDFKHYCDENDIAVKGDFIYRGVKTMGKLSMFKHIPVEYANKFGTEVASKIFGVKEASLKVYIKKMTATATE